MGVPGLWDILRPASTRQSLSSLARHAFHTTDLKALTIGIDASIWIFHAAVPQSGENPFMRTIFFKITSLLHQPVLPVFVFDGPAKPGYKRNQRVGGSFGTSDTRSRQFKELLDEMGLEWWNAPGEAEAELAMMNRQGKIDAVMSDDVDALLFGATCLIRNNSPTLSQNKGKEGDQKGYDVYRSTAIAGLLAGKEETALQTEEDCRMAMVLVALLAGGDYVPEGLTAFGPTIALGLAHAGFADILKSYMTDPEGFKSQLSAYQSRMVEELKTNGSGHIGRRYPDRANKLSAQSSDSLLLPTALNSYLSPTISSPRGPPEWPGFGNGERSIRRGKARNEGRGDLEGMATACERFFEWGTKDRVVRKFARDTVGVYGTQLVNAARNAVRSQSRLGSVTPLQPSQVAASSRITSFFPEVRNTQPMGKSTFISSQASSFPGSPCSTPDHIIQIHSTRVDPTDSEQTEYRISYEHAPYTARVRGAMTGARIDPNDLDLEMKAALGMVDRGQDEDAPTTELKNEVRIWIADYLVKGAWPELVHKYEEGLRMKEAGKAAKGRPRMKKTLSKKDASNDDSVDAEAFKSFFSARPAMAMDKPGQGSSQTTKPLTSDSDSDIEVIENPAFVSAVQTRTRHHPTSSISSLSSLRSPTPPIAASLALPPLRRTVRTRSKISPSRSTRSVALKSKTSSASTRSDEVIDMCSSEDETPKASRSRILSPITSTNAATPRRESRRVARTSPKKTRPTASTQSRLELPVVAPQSQAMTGKSAAAPQTPQKAVRAKKKKYACVVLSETSDEEFLDMTVRA